MRALFRKSEVLPVVVDKLLLTARAVTSQQFTPLETGLLLCDVREHQGHYLAARRR